MKATRVWAAAAGIAFVTWIVATELPWPARAYMAFLLGVLPALSILQAQAATQLESLPGRMKLYLSTIVSLWGLAVVAAIAASESGFNPRLLGVIELPWPTFLLWLVVSLAGASAVVVGFKAFGLSETPVLQHLIPETAAEKAVYVGVSLSAGICEELVFRGFLIAAINVASGSIVLAVLLSAGAFGIAHAHQNAIGALRATMLALVLTVPLLVTGSLYPGIAAHAIVDLAGGLWLSKWLLKSE
jgi:membrane protease YdiL (CAAX protease family)